MLQAYLNPSATPRWIPAQSEVRALETLSNIALPMSNTITRQGKHLEMKSTNAFII
jgi:hypothetical protein